jgi:hypothetical protein
VTSRTATALVLPMLLATACGGGSGTASAGVSKKAFLAQAESICAKANVEKKALKPVSGATDFSRFVTELVALADRATTALAAVPEPTADKADLTKHVLAPLQKQLTEAHTYSAAVKKASDAHDLTKMASLAASAPTKPQADLTWMRGYGFKQCVDVADTSS